jgi:hypothetical protein
MIIKSEKFSILEIKSFLEESSSKDLELQLNNEEEISFEGFNLDPVSLITAGSGIAVAIITGIFAYINTKNTGEILIKTQNIEVKIPRNATKEELNMVKQFAQSYEKEIKLIQISDD